MRIETRTITSQSQLSALYTELNNASLFWKQGTALEIEFASGTYTLTQPLSQSDNKRNTHQPAIDWGQCRTSDNHSGDKEFYFHPR